MHYHDLNLRHLYAAVSVARLGSISAAAKTVNLTQPAITQAIAKLEKQAGMPLFMRTPEGMLATEAGAIITARAHAALDHISSSRVTMSQVRSFLALAQNGGYAAASSAAGVTEPSLHRAVKDLAVAIGKELVERRGRGVRLTEVGWATARAFGLAKAELEAGLSDVAALAGREKGRIAIGAMPLCRARLLPMTMAAFLREHPETEISITEGSYKELLEPLRDGDLDFMIGALRERAARDVEQSPLFEDRPIVVGRPGHPLMGRRPRQQDLARYPWIVPAKGAPLRRQWDDLFHGTSPSTREAPIECGSVMVSRGVMMETNYLTLLSVDQVGAEFAAGWLVKICDAPDVSVRVVGVSSRIGWRPSKLQEAFCRVLERVAAKIK
ncbi:MAG: LysR substrate-binding domain-containing protein [Pseudomonadota bacterium]